MAFWNIDQSCLLNVSAGVPCRKLHVPIFAIALQIFGTRRIVAEKMVAAKVCLVTFIN